MPLRNLLPILLLASSLAGTPPAETPPAPPDPLPPLAIPPEPAVVPGYTALDPTTGLHMTGTPKRIDIARYRLKVTGKVVHPLSLSYDELRRMPRLTTKEAINCRGYFEDYANWAGCSLISLLDRAVPGPTAAHLKLISADGYDTSVTLQEARSGYAFLAYEWQGKALPYLHGYPVRASFPGLPGYKWVKWLVEIRVE
jgi:DMSO/TMAO reductase YedYZ molybdopterin-dependent catalytic subunit